MSKQVALWSKPVSKVILSVTKDCDGGGIVVPTVMLSGGGRSSEMLNGQRAAAVNGGGCRKEIVRIIHTANVQRYAKVVNDTYLVI